MAALQRLNLPVPFKCPACDKGMAFNVMAEQTGQTTTPAEPGRIDVRFKIVGASISHDCMPQIPRDAGTREFNGPYEEGQTL